MQNSDTYPLLSAKSKVLNAAGAILFEVWALKIVLPPRLCTIVTQEEQVRQPLSSIKLLREGTLRHKPGEACYSGTFTYF